MLGSQYVNHQCKETVEPYWIKTDVGEQANIGFAGPEGQYEFEAPNFKIIRNGVHFTFSRGVLGEQGNEGGKGGVDGARGSSRVQRRIKAFLEQVVFKVQIQPQKYKTIETPIHLFGELVKTKQGTAMIRERNDIKLFRKKLLDEKATSQEKRSILWTLGHIGSYENGIRLIMETSLVKDIIEMAENSPILSLRGTCIYTIGMMCRTKMGRREIQKHNWLYSQSQVASGSDSICLPRDPRNLFQVDGGKFQGSIICQPKVVQNMKDIKLEIPLNKEEQEILDLIGSLINGVTWQQAYNDLQKAQERKPKAFLNPRLFEHVVMYLSVYNRMQPKTRKFIFNLFDQLIFQNKMLKERFVHV